LGAMYGKSRRGLSTRTGPTIRMTSGVCVPGASWLVFAPLLWANALEKAPVPNTATAMPARQKRAAIKTRRLKKADCEVDFFFMDGFLDAARSRCQTTSFETTVAVRGCGNLREKLWTITRP